MFLVMIQKCLSAQVSKLISLEKDSEENPKDEEGWSQVKDKGRRKVGKVAPDPLSTSSDAVSANMAEGQLNINWFNSQLEPSGPSLEAAPASAAGENPVDTEQFDTSGEEVQDPANSTLEKNNKSAKSVVEAVKVHQSSGKGSSSQRRKKR